MSAEFQINVEYANGKEGEHLTFRFSNRELRNNVYNSVLSTFKKSKVDSNHLNKKGGIIVSSINYIPPTPGAIAQFVSQEYFSFDVLDEMLNLIKVKSL